MTNPTPNFPGKPAQTGAQPKTPAWANAICPFLTAGEVARQGPPSNIVQLGTQQKSQVAAQACLGPRCMLFAQLKAATGEVLEGCAPMHTLQAQLALNSMVGQFIEAARAGAAAEAAAQAQSENKVTDVHAAVPAATPAQEG